MQQQAEQAQQPSTVHLFIKDDGISLKLSERVTDQEQPVKILRSSFDPAALAEVTDIPAVTQTVTIAMSAEHPFVQRTDIEQYAVETLLPRSTCDEQKQRLVRDLVDSLEARGYRVKVTDQQRRSKKLAVAS